MLPQRLTVLADAETVLAGVARLAPTADDNTLRAELARFLLDADTVVGRSARFPAANASGPAWPPCCWPSRPRSC